MKTKLPFVLQQWSLANDGTRATHISGLIVTFDGKAAVVNQESAEAMRQQMMADLGNDWHFSAELYELVAQAEQLFAMQFDIPPRATPAR